MMVIVVGALILLIIILVSYIIFLQLQLRHINLQLTKRLMVHTRQPISLELINKELNALVININKCLKVEELLRLDSIREEKRFKELITNISHDLRTPLTAIKGYQQLIEKDELNDNQREKMQIAQKHAHELEKLIEHFFEYSYLVTTALKLNREHINLTNLVTECLTEFVMAFEKNNLAVCFEETVPVFALVDQEMTTRIIQNLIRNCMEHSDGDIIVKTITEKNATISFKNPVKNPSVIDVNRLFDRFYTSDQARSNSTGLGLSIVRILTEQMGGRARASLEGDLLEICVELPLDVTIR